MMMLSYWIVKTRVSKNCRASALQIAIVKHAVPGPGPGPLTNLRHDMSTSRSNLDMSCRPRLLLLAPNSPTRSLKLLSTQITMNTHSLPQDSQRGRFLNLHLTLRFEVRIKPFETLFPQVSERNEWLEIKATKQSLIQDHQGQPPRRLPQLLPISNIYLCL